MKKNLAIAAIVLVMGISIVWLAIVCKRQHVALHSLCGIAGYSAQTHRLLAEQFQNTNQQAMAESIGWLLFSDSHLADVSAFCAIPWERKSGFILDGKQAYEHLRGTIFQTSPRQNRNVDWTNEDTIKQSIGEDFKKRNAKTRIDPTKP